jgi:hypothetical protein
MSALHSRKHPRASKLDDMDSHAFAAYLTADSAALAELFRLLPAFAPNPEPAGTAGSDTEALVDAAGPES